MRTVSGTRVDVIEEVTVSVCVRQLLHMLLNVIEKVSASDGEPKTLAVGFFCILKWGHSNYWTYVFGKLRNFMVPLWKPTVQTRNHANIITELYNNFVGL